MGNTWFVSDTHFGHANMLKFTGEDGSLIRPFPTSDAMDWRMIREWNNKVLPEDNVYHLGDVTYHTIERYSHIHEMLNGKKHLILGNHDVGKSLTPFFETVSVVRMFKKHGFMISHYPLHPSSLYDYKSGRQLINVHGHTHEKDVDEPGYINISVEKTNFSPISFNTILKMVAEERKKLDEYNLVVKMPKTLEI